jgi:serine beta-lactamase-like protein LACTB, mitochondrial
MRIISLLLATVITFPLAAQPAAAQRATEHLRGFMVEHRIPGLSIAVGQNGKVLWTGSFGVEDLDSKAPVTPTSVVPLGSTSKTLTSLALGKLVEEGRLDLDAPIQKYVPYFPKKEHVLTPRLLAGHLAGLRDYDMAAGEYANTREFPSVREAVAVFKDDPLLFEPGTRYAYSVYNFVLLSAAIEGASGRDFLTYLRERIVKPSRLERTGPNRAPVKGLVTSYATGFGGIVVKAPETNVSNKWAAGGLVSTPTEMVRLGNAILMGKIVKPETFTLLTTPQKLKDGGETGAGYAMGWRSGTKRLSSSGRELRIVHHGGTAHGAMSFFVIFPESGLVVSMQGNLLFQPFTDFSNEAFMIAEMFLDDAT